MHLNFESKDNKEEVFEKITTYLGRKALSLAKVEINKPWGGFFVIDEKSTERFVDIYFPDQEIASDNKISPKILVVEPYKRLSWQYHLRRGELWSVIKGPVGFMTSHDDIPGNLMDLKEGENVNFDPLIRHRLIGLDNLGVVAEIWKHTDNTHPSNEEDIIRVQDDWGR